MAPHVSEVGGVYSWELGRIRVTAISHGVQICAIEGEDVLGGSSAILPSSS